MNADPCGSRSTALGPKLTFQLVSDPDLKLTRLPVVVLSFGVHPFFRSNIKFVLLLFYGYFIRNGSCLSMPGNYNM